MKLYCYYDRVVGSYSRYFTAVNDEDAIRISRVMLAQAPFRDDLDLFLVAKIDDRLGCCLPPVADDYNVVFVCRVSELFTEVAHE